MCACRLKFLWNDVVLVTEPAALASIMGRGEHAVDKAFETYAPINKMCDPHCNPNLLTSEADATWKAVRKAVAVSFSVQVSALLSYPIITQVVHVLTRDPGLATPVALGSLFPSAMMGTQTMQA